MVETPYFKQKDIELITQIDPESFHNGVHNLIRRALSVNVIVIKPQGLLKRLKEGVIVKSSLGSYNPINEHGDIRFSVEDFRFRNIPAVLEEEFRRNHIRKPSKLDVTVTVANQAFDGKRYASIAIYRFRQRTQRSDSLRLTCRGNTFDMENHTPDQVQELAGALLAFVGSKLDEKLA